MEESSFSQWLEWIQANPWWAMGIAFLISLLESLAVVGLFVPGIVLLFAIGAIVGMDPQPLLMVCVGVSAGAVLGDGLSWWLGYRYSDRLRHVWPFSSRPYLLEGGQIFFLRHGGKSIFIGRFVGALRPIVPIVGGMLRMRPRQFFAMDIPACLLWGPVYILPGALFGASLEVASEFAGRLALLMAILVGGVWLLVWAVRVLYEMLVARSTWWLKSAVLWSRRHPLLGRVTAPLLDPSRPEVISIAMLGLLLAVSVSVLLSVLVLAPFGTPAWDAERRAAGMAASLRNHFADPLFVVLSLAGDSRVMAMLAGVSALILLALRRVNAAWHWLVAILGAWLLALLLNGFMSLLLDTPYMLEPLGLVPHPGFTLATVVFGFFAVMLAKDLSARRRKWPYLLTTTILALIGFAHFYLGQASVSGLLAGLTLGTGWLALVGIAYRQRARRRSRPWLLALCFYSGFVLLAALHVGGTYQLTLETTRLAQPQRIVHSVAWWESEWASLQQRRSRIGQHAVQRFDLQLAGDLQTVRNDLRSAGWEELPAVTAEGLARAFSHQTDEQELPNLRRDFAGRPEDLGMRLHQADGQILVLRLWASGVLLGDTGQPVFLGQLRRMELRPRLGLVTLWMPVEDDQDVGRESIRRGLEHWEWREPDSGPWLIRRPGAEPEADPAGPVGPAAPGDPDGYQSRRAAAPPDATPE